MAAYWLQSLATLAADKQEANGRARAAALFFSGIAPCQWKRDTAGQRQVLHGISAQPGGDGFASPFGPEI